MALLIFLGCKKENDSLLPPTPNEFKELTVSPNFKWNTSKVFTLKFVGVTTSAPTSSGVLVITSLPDNNELLRIRHVMKDNKDFQLNLPGHVKQIRVRYGIVEKDLPAQGVSASFIPVPELKDE
ncbi:MAG: hypothetical protein N3D13_02150 [Thermaurantimonas aggregans]|nr:hypothetical protein [Thermaurantimonas aggregans]